MGQTGLAIETRIVLMHPIRRVSCPPITCALFISAPGFEASQKCFWMTAFNFSSSRVGFGRRLIFSPDSDLNGDRECGRGPMGKSDLVMDGEEEDSLTGRANRLTLSKSSHRLAIK